MGFDLYGRNKKALPDKGTPGASKDSTPWTDGIYFRNNVWWWHPLWEYVCANCSHILTQKDMDGGGGNGGYFITKKKDIAIADVLDAKIKSGDVKRFANDRDKEQKKLPDVNRDICDGTGKRTDSGVKSKCNGCNGTGKKRPFETNYPFDRTNVEQFSKFCRASGGFEIC